MKPYLSVIVVAFQEGELIGRTLLEIDSYFARKKYSYEILVIVDGRKNKTAEIVRNYAERIRNLEVIENIENKGKGYSVRNGLLKCKGKYRVFLDADGATSINHLDKFMPEFKNGYDVVIGSRNLPNSFIQVRQPRYREMMGFLSNFIIKLILNLWNYPDTQCGFKVFSEKSAKEIASRMTVDRFGFDFEIIALAEKMGLKIKQVPVRWLNEGNSTVKFIGPNSYIQALVDLIKTKIRFLNGSYGVEKKRNK